MKKITIIILSIFLTSIFIAYLWYGNMIQDTSPSSLSGFPITENLYKFYLNNDTYNLNGYYIKNNDIYFLLDKEEYYELYKENIYDPKAFKIGRVDSNGYCNLENSLIICSTLDNISVYDIELNLRYETSFSEENIIDVVPYKDIFLKINNINISLIQNNEEIQFRTLEEKFNDYTFIKYFYQQDNTYLLYIDFNTNVYYLYDIKTGKYEEITLANYNLYENGIYFYNEETFKIYNLKENTIKEFSNPLKTSGNYNTTISNDNKTLYLLDNLEKSLEIIDLENDTIEKTSISALVNNEILEIIYSNNYLYIVTNENKTNIYIYDLPLLSLTKTNLTEYVLEQEKINTELINTLENKYNIKIHIREDAIIKYPDFKAELLSDYRLISTALAKIETILNKATPAFFDTFYENNYDGLNIYLTGELTPNNYDIQYSNPIAYSLIYNNEYMIVLNIQDSSLEENFCHELMHNIEFNIETTIKEPFSDWDKYNPSDFTYAFSYTTGTDYGYTIYESDINDAYFIDTYAHTYPNEDRARIFEKICAYDTDSIINQFPNLLAKAKYLKEVVVNSFPSLDESGLFDSLDNH